MLTPVCVHTGRSSNLETARQTAFNLEQALCIACQHAMLVTPLMLKPVCLHTGRGSAVI